MSPAPLLGISAIARRLGVSRQRVHVLATHDGFPAPVHELETGRLWREGDVEKWVAAHPQYDHSSKDAEPAAIVVTPADREWLRAAAAIVKGGEATERVRKAAATNLERIAYRADVADRETPAA